jgi:glycosyltransferase involved in cell wall biosynthesis
MKKSIIYVSYDGLTDPLGQSQVVPYLTKISNENNKIDIISFEKKEAFEKSKKNISHKLKGANIVWHNQIYTKNPPVLSTILDIYSGLKMLKKLHKKNNYQIVHCRGYIAGLMGLKLKYTCNISLIFDMRGWWPDEKLESGNWNSLIFKPIYKYFKNLELKLFKHSDKTISLTYVGKQEILKNIWATEDKIGVIPTCVDFDNFPEYNPETRKLIRKTLSIKNESKVLVYSGSIGGNYDFEDFAVVFQTFLKISLDNQIIILSKTPLDYLNLKINEFKIDKRRLRIISAQFIDVHKYLHASDIGLIIYKREFSTLGRSPTKLGEYWASGIPALSLKGIGDLELIISKYPYGGKLINNLTETELIKAFNVLIKNSSKESLRSAAKDFYHINKGVEFYSNIYNELA